MLQDATSAPHTWKELVYYALVAALAYGSSYLPAIFRRRQSNAETEKTRAETRQIDLSTTIHAGDIVIGLIGKVAEATASVDRLKVEKEFWQGKVGALEAERNLLQAQLDKQISIGQPD